MTTTLTGTTVTVEPVAVRIIEQDRSRVPIEFRGQPFDALLEALKADVSGFKAPIIEAADKLIAFGDADCHHWDSPPPFELVEATVSGIHPTPAAWWQTHGGGIRTVHVGSDADDALARAALAMISLPRDWSLEVKRDSRHPRGAHPRRPGATCTEPVVGTVDTTKLSFTGTAADPETTSRWLAERGMVVGGRYNHALCPIDPAHASDGKPVAVYAGHLHCFSCAGRGAFFVGCRTAGHVPFATLIGLGGELVEIAVMARRFVHATHAIAVLRARHPRASDKVLEAAYRAALSSFAKGDGDARPFMALDKDLLIVRTHGLWLHSKELTPIKLKATYSCLPWAFDATQKADSDDAETEEGSIDGADGDGKPTPAEGSETEPSDGTTPAVKGATSPDSASAEPDANDDDSGVDENDGFEVPSYEIRLAPPRLDLLASSARLEGYVPIRPVRGVILRPEAVDSDEVVIVTPPRRGAPVELLRGTDLMAEDEAFAVIERGFPGVHHQYLKSLFAAAACAESPGQPAMIHAVGPSGSGKGETPRLAASGLGDTVLKLVLDMETEKFRRSVGAAATSGSRLLQVDEVGKIRRLGTHLRLLLELSSEITWRNLFHSGDIVTPLRSVFVFTNLSVPEVMSSAPEYCRRVRLVRLPRRVPNWNETCGGDTAAWRAQSPDHARALNSILTHSAALAASHEFVWERVADALELGRPDEGEGVDEEALVDLYRHARGEFGRRTVVQNGRFGKGHWIDLRTPGASLLLDRLMPTDDEDEGVFHLRNKLESVGWNDLLLIDSPSIICEVKNHRRQIVVRFRADIRCKKGDEVLNEALPRDAREDIARDPFCAPVAPPPIRVTGVAGVTAAPCEHDAVSVWVQSSCESNAGPGGYAAVVEMANRRVELSGGEPVTTSDRTFLMAAIVALEQTPPSKAIVVVSGSRVLVDGAVSRSRSGCLPGVTDSDLWRRLLAAAQRHERVSWRWLQGVHGGPQYERAAALARTARRRADGAIGPLDLEVTPVALPAERPETGDLFSLLAGAPDAPEGTGA